MTRRILLGHLSMALFVLLVLEIPLAIFFADRERERFASGVASDAAVLATRYEDALEHGDPLDAAPAEDYAESTGARVVVVDADARSVLDTDAPEGRPFGTRPEVADALLGTPERGTRRSDTLGTDLLYVAVPIASGGTVHGALRVTLPTSEVDERIQRFWVGLVVSGTIVLVVVVGLGWTLARSVTRPLRELEDAATAFGEGDLTPRPPPARAPEEIASLSRTLNQMAEDLRRLLEAQRAFVADASHQLRTPLTALRLRVENLGDVAGDAGQDDTDAAVTEIERLSELVEQLLALARADRPVERAPTDLVRLVRDRVDTWQAVATAGGRRLELDLPAAPLIVPVTPGAVEQALDNVIDNALGASPEAGAVTVALAPTGTGATIEVRDHGPGLSDADKDRALDRFWRGRTDRPGTGLGLPIAAVVAEAHGGGVRLQDTPGGGLTVAIELSSP